MEEADDRPGVPRQPPAALGASIGAHPSPLDRLDGPGIHDVRLGQMRQ
jgi:hypothetical protein